MEHLSAADIHRGGVRPQPHQCAARATRTIPAFSSCRAATASAASRPSLNGYVTDEWQSKFGYAYTDARVTSNTSATIVAGNRVQLVPFNQFSWWNKYQFTPMWAASLGVIYFSDSFASSDDTVRLPGFVRFDAGDFREDQRDLEGAAQHREHLQQGLLGFGGRQQQHLAGAAARGPADRHRQVLSAIATVPAGAGLKDQILLLIQVAQVRLAARQ